MQRIEGVLNEHEVPDWACSLKSSTPEGDPENPDQAPISLTTATFEWHTATQGTETPNQFLLGPLDIVFPSGKLTLVTGATGSGKSALLAALLGGEYKQYA